MTGLTLHLNELDKTGKMSKFKQYFQWVYDETDSLLLFMKNITTKQKLNINCII
jgi:hypothetical protein